MVMMVVVVTIPCQMMGNRRQGCYILVMVVRMGLGLLGTTTNRGQPACALFVAPDVLLFRLPPFSAIRPTLDRDIPAQRLLHGVIGVLAPQQASGPIRKLGSGRNGA
jgi:hypothetical protein